MPVSAHIIRLQLDGSKSGHFKDVLTGQPPFGWNGNNHQFQLGVQYGKALRDVSNLDAITLEVRDFDNPAGTIFFSGTVAYANINRDLTLADWQAGTDQHAVIDVPWQDAVFDLGGAKSKKYWIVVSALTTDVPAKRVPLGVSIFTMLEDGTPSAEAISPIKGGNLIPPGATYDVSGNYVFNGVTVGGVYEWTKAQNDTDIRDGATIYSTSPARFTAENTSFTLTGTPDATVTAQLRRPTFYTAEESDARYTPANAIDGLSNTLNAHLDGGPSKHDATEIDYERTDGSKKNIQGASDDVENALTDLDDAIGAKSGLDTTDKSTLVDAINELVAVKAHAGWFEAASQAAMLALAAQKGNYARRTDIGQTFVLTTDDPTVLSNWKQVSNWTGVKFLEALAISDPSAVNHAFAVSLVVGRKYRLAYVRGGIKLEPAQGWQMGAYTMNGAEGDPTIGNITQYNSVAECTVGNQCTWKDFIADETTLTLALQDVPGGYGDNSPGTPPTLFHLYRYATIEEECCVDCPVNSYESQSVSAAGNYPLAPTKPVHTARLSAAAGSGAYTAKFILPIEIANEGDRLTIRLAVPASVNPTVEFRNATSGGTLLDTKNGELTAKNWLIDFVFDGSGWVKQGHASDIVESAGGDMILAEAQYVTGEKKFADGAFKLENEDETAAATVKSGGTVNRTLTLPDKDGTLRIIPVDSTLAYAASVAINFAGDEWKTLSLTGDVVFTAVNLTEGAEVHVHVIADSSDRAIGYPAAWRALNHLPRFVPANSRGVLKLRSRGTADSSVIAEWIPEGSGMSYKAVSVTGAGNTEVKGPQGGGSHSIKVTVTDVYGGGAFTHVLFFPVAKAQKGDRIYVAMTTPDSVDPTIEYRNDTSGGTLLLSIASESAATSWWADFVFNGIAWELEKNGSGELAGGSESLATDETIGAVSAAGNSNVTMPAGSIHHTVSASAAAGAGAYTHTFSIPVANRDAGDVVMMRFGLPASTNPTLEVRNDTAGGTLLTTITSAATASEAFGIYKFNGTAWVEVAAGFID
jgi:hypothetical protein